jgi:hypothetical protein
MLISLILNPVIIIVVLESTGILQKMHILKYLVRRNMLVRIGLIKLLLRIIILIILVLIVHFIAKSRIKQQKISNSLELLQGPIEDIQKKYEILSDIVITEYNGKVHGSQSHIINNNLISLVVYFEVPEGKREEVKQKFNNFILSVKITTPTRY